jgi:hypothetical protein
VKSLTVHFDKLDDTYLLVEPLRGLKITVEQRFPDASDDDKTFFDDLIARCGPAPVLKLQNESLSPDQLGIVIVVLFNDCCSNCVYYSVCMFQFTLERLNSHLTVIRK